MRGGLAGGGAGGVDSSQLMLSVLLAALLSQPAPQPSEPYVVRENGSLWTTEERCSALQTVTPLHASDYAVLYPVSVLRTATGELNVGMRHAVARLERDGGGYRETWLVPPDCPPQVRSNTARCECLR